MSYLPAPLIGKKFERKSLKILKEKFDKVEWISKEIPTSYYDFRCTKDNKVYLVDAKFSTSKKKVYLSYKQKDLDYLIINIAGEIILVENKDFSKYSMISRDRTPVDIRPPIKVIRTGDVQTKKIINGKVVEYVSIEKVKSLGNGGYLHVPKDLIGRYFRVELLEENKK